MIPKVWKEATVIPIFKGGSKKKPGNYRPVSLTSQVCKLLERLIRRNITEHMESNHIISDHQHGFVRKRSCQSNLMETFEDWTSLIDEGNGVDVIYLDYRKAFDTVPHERLKAKLHGYGIRGNILKWISEFLRNRTQRVHPKSRAHL